MKKTDTKFILSLFVTAAVLGLLFVLIKRVSPPERVDSGYREAMGTFARVVCVHEDPAVSRKAIEGAFDQIHQVEKLMNIYDEDSQISKINRAAYAEPVKVDHAVFEVIEKSVLLSGKTDGAFDITAGPVINLWREAQQQDEPPTQQQIEQALAKVGSEKIVLERENSTVAFSVEGMLLDLGGIAKGYAADLAVKAIKDAGADGAMVDIGGDIRVFGKAPKGAESWLIGLQDPERAEPTALNSRPFVVLVLNDFAVTTSGHYHRFTEIDGARHSHIIDIHTGQSADGLASVTVFAPTAAQADALATAVAVMGKEKGLELIESLENTEAILIDPQSPDELIKTTGADKFIR